MRWLAYTLLDAGGIKLLGQVSDETATWDVYEVRHRNGDIRTYALQLWSP
jgi:hypothetical protein